MPAKGGRRLVIAKSEEFSGLSRAFAVANLPPALAYTDQNGDHSKRGAWRSRKGLARTTASQLTYPPRTLCYFTDRSGVNWMMCFSAPYSSGVVGQIGSFALPAASGITPATALSYFTLAKSKSSVQPNETFILTCTARNADGTVDTDYATQVNITENSTPLSLKTDAGAAFTSFAGGDFTNGVAAAAIKFDGALVVSATVRITAAEDGAPTITGFTDINAVVHPAAYWT